MNRTTRLTSFDGGDSDQPSARSQEPSMYDQDNPSQEPRQDPAGGDVYTLPAEPITPKPPTQGNGRRRATAAILGSLLVGGAAGAAILGTRSADAASPTASGAPTGSAAPSTGTTTDADGDGHGGRGGPGHIEAVSDTSVAAKAIGITEADLLTALQGGQTMADVAKAHNVAVQKVIDALVTDGLDELAAEVKAGTLTQAQADAKKAEVTQRATDQVNGAFHGGPGGRGGPGGHVEAVSDASVAAKAIGTTEAELKTALDAGQTMAAVAKAHNVDVQKVIDALVADELDELAAEVKAGTLTQAQADARKPTIAQRMTDRVNGVHP
jgi:hypothetical protein